MSRSIACLFVLPVVTCAVLAGCPGLTEPGDPVVFADPPPSASATVANAPPPAATPTPAPAPTPTPAPAPTHEVEEKVQASHILVSWKGAQRSTQTRTKEEAKKRIDELIAKVKKGGDFAKLAGEYGEDGTKAVGGDLGTFGKGQMVPVFENAAFALKPGEVSGIVESPFGFHVIKRVK
ncbi:MAG: peptidylprolyl isomerase [Polyangiales bacterium]